MVINFLLLLHWQALQMKSEDLKDDNSKLQLEINSLKLEKCGSWAYDAIWTKWFWC